MYMAWCRVLSLTVSHAIDVEDGVGGSGEGSMVTFEGAALGEHRGSKEKRRGSTNYCVHLAYSVISPCVRPAKEYNTFVTCNISKFSTKTHISE